MRKLYEVEKTPCVVNKALLLRIKKFEVRIGSVGKRPVWAKLQSASISRAKAQKTTDTKIAASLGVAIVCPSEFLVLLDGYAPTVSSIWRDHYKRKEVRHDPTTQLEFHCSLCVYVAILPGTGSGTGSDFSTLCRGDRKGKPPSTRPQECTSTR
jgi:hypothetical protein